VSCDACHFDLAECVGHCRRSETEAADITIIIATTVDAAAAATVLLMLVVLVITNTGDHSSMIIPCSCRDDA